MHACDCLSIWRDCLRDYVTLLPIVYLPCAKHTMTYDMNHRRAVFDRERELISV